jgi:hypothetical protein
MLRHCVQVATPPRYPHVGEKHRRVERVIKHMDYTGCFDEDPAALMQFSTRLYPKLLAYLTELAKPSSAISMDWSGVDHFQTDP